LNVFDSTVIADFSCIAEIRKSGLKVAVRRVQHEWLVWAVRCAWHEGREPDLRRNRRDNMQDRRKLTFGFY
jgi:hypothetical protein